MLRSLRGLLLPFSALCGDIGLIYSALLLIYAFFADYEELFAECARS